RRVLQREHPLAGQATLGGGLRGSGDVALGRAFKILEAVDDDAARLVCGEEPALEFRRERGLFLIQLAQLCLVRFAKPRACTHEVETISLREMTLLRRQPGGVARGKNLLDPR